MTKQFLFAGLIAALLLLNGCGDENEVLPNPIPSVVETKVRYDELWSITVGDGVQDEFLKLHPAESYGKIFIADVSGKLMAIDPEKGSKVWQTTIEQRISAGVTVANRIAVVGTREGQVMAFDVESGEQLWTSQLSSEVIASPAVGDGYVVANTVDGKIVALDASSGEQKWFYDRTLPALTLRGTSSPVIALGAAISGFANGKVGVFLLENGQLAWERQITTPSGRSDLERLVDVDGQPVVFGSTLYATSFNGNIMALELRSGEPLWSRELSSYQDIEVDNQTLLVTQDNGYVTSMNRNNGVLLWTQKALFLRQTTSPTAFGDHIVVGDMGGYLHMLDKASGQLIGQLNINSSINYTDCYDSAEACRFHNHEEYGVATKPFIVDDKLVVLTRNGHMIAYKQRKDAK
ncbi:outer membrane protein assembly factor BamB [Pleionea litopenaei]|uniref:Outer membrane protein assembly factor BamB n=1 Tax=Pleionea litopenaei TaxID=3070815 RepID=A0AA51X8D5_9GAMM|nr:outer membrane protein assembly factor BamB [Pleionea sp. HL-JVS1]WMS88856.1 outer membrane protein assembly factor BamB [Pleionea sp. HL-JVS1]